MAEIDIGSIFGSAIEAGTSLLGGSLSRKFSSDQALMNLAWQQKLAQEGLRMKAADARAAEKKYGINALTMLGVQGPTSSTVMAGDGGDMGIANAGKAVGRAISGMGKDDSEDRQLDRDYRRAQIDLVRAQTAKILNPGAPPEFPARQTVSGQGNSGTSGSQAGEGLKLKQEVKPESVASRGTAEGVGPDVELDRTVRQGRTTPQFSKESQSSIDVLGMLANSIRNRLMPMWFEESYPEVERNRKAPEGYVRRFNPVTQEYFWQKDRRTDFYKRMREKYRE